MSGLIETLREVPYFADLDDVTLARTASDVRTRSYRAGELILMEGAHCRGLTFVISGRVKVFKVSPEGREQVLRILAGSRTFNDVPVFDGGPNPANVSALESTAIGMLPIDRVQKLISEHPTVAAASARVLASRLRAAVDLVEDLALRGVTARVAHLILQCSRGSPPLAEGPGNHCARLTQKQLAAMTGSVREVVQRSLKVLEGEGAIALARGSICVVEPAILETWSGTEPERAALAMTDPPGMDASQRSAPGRPPR